MIDEKCVNFDVNDCQVEENEVCEEVVKTECAPATTSVLDLNIDKYDDWFHRRNAEWDKNLEPITDLNLITFIEKWDGINE